MYRHIRLDKNEVFYVGIGKVKKTAKYKQSIYSRGYTKHSRNKHWNNIVKNTEYLIDIMYESNNSKEIKKKEIEFIKIYGRRDLGTGTLVNMTDGGEGCFNPAKESLMIGKLNGNAKKVFRYDIEGNFIKKYDALADAVRDINGNIKSDHNGIVACCTKRIHIFKKSLWFYKYQGKKVNYKGTKLSKYLHKPIGKYDINTLKL